MRDAFSIVAVGETPAKTANKAQDADDALAARVECGAIEASPMHASALVDCLVAERPGLNCDLAKARIWAGSSATADRYSGQQERPSASPGTIRRAHALVFDLLATAVDAGADGVQLEGHWQGGALNGAGVRRRRDGLCG